MTNAAKDIDPQDPRVLQYKNEIERIIMGPPRALDVIGEEKPYQFKK
jgi:hypothetical protein